jgi:DNA-binding XRE family transcriptional regulator
LTAAAVERVKRRSGAETPDEIAAALGVSRRTYYRLVNGSHDVHLSRAHALAGRIGWPLTRVFEPGRPRG